MVNVSIVMMYMVKTVPNAVQLNAQLATVKRIKLPLLDITEFVTLALMLKNNVKLALLIHV